MADVRPARSRAVNSPNRNVSNPLSMAGSSHVPQSWWESTKAGFRGAADSLPFDAADYTAAAVRALVDAARHRDLRASFNKRFAAEKAQDRYDEANHPTARTVGKVAGTVAQVALPGSNILGVARVARMAQAARALKSEQAVVAGIGGAVGVAAQGVSDIARGRPSSAADYAGSFVGGALGGAAAMRGRPGLIGSATGAATSVAQDTFNGRLHDARAVVERAADAAATGNLLAAPVGIVGAKVTQRLPVRAKGNLGEWMSERRTWLRREPIDKDVAKYFYPSKGKTIPDHWSNGKPIEAKFGISHKYLKGVQARTFKENGYHRVDHFMPNDVGAALELPAGVLSYLANGTRDR